MAWPGQSLNICASQLHQVCIEVLPHPQEGVWHLNAVLQQCLHAFHQQQLYDGLASIGSRRHDGLRCLTSAVCHAYEANLTRDDWHCQRWRSHKCRCPNTIMDDVTTLAQSNVGTHELLDHFYDLFTWPSKKAQPKYFPCPWDHLWHPFLHSCQHHPHSQGAASQEPRQVICLPNLLNLM